MNTIHIPIDAEYEPIGPATRALEAYAQTIPIAERLGIWVTCVLSGSTQCLVPMDRQRMPYGLAVQEPSAKGLAPQFSRGYNKDDRNIIEDFWLCGVTIFNKLHPIGVRQDGTFTVGDEVIGLTYRDNFWTASLGLKEYYIGSDGKLSNEPESPDSLRRQMTQHILANPVQPETRIFPAKN